jgi:hypothetical protein
MASLVVCCLAWQRLRASPTRCDRRVLRDTIDQGGHASPCVQPRRGTLTITRGSAHLKERRRVARATDQRQENSSIRCAARTRVRIADLVTNASVARDVFACEGGLWCVSFQLLSSTTIGSSRGVPPPTARTRFRLLVASTFIAAHVGSRDEVERTSSAGRGAFSSLCSLSTHELRCGTVADSTGAEPLHDGAIAGDESKRTSTSRVGVATSTGG